jgi:hypothetical protein
MRLRSLLLVLSFLPATGMLTGCCSLLGIDCGPGGGANTGGAGSGTFYVWTKTASGVWANANVTGSAEPFSYSCDPTSDQDCYTNFSGFTTGNNGELIFSTDALPATWTAAATGDSTCPSGGNSGPLSISNGLPIVVHCGATSAGTFTASPASCTWYLDQYTGEWDTSNCPASLTLTSNGPIFPTSYALNATAYDDTATEMYTGSYTASSSITIVVPAPTTAGTTVLTIVDPTTNEVLGTAVFTITKSSKCNPKNC